MNNISADQKHETFKVLVSRSLTQLGANQYQIAVTQVSRDMGMTNCSFLSFSLEEWETIGGIVKDLRREISIHTLTSAK